MRTVRLAMAGPRNVSPYHNWTREELISRLHQLESNQAPSTLKKAPSEPFLFSSHPRRKIALKFSYSGPEYNGLAFQKNYTPLPTVEGVLFDALAKTRLVDPTKGFEGCQWERCGRTDRGVSAAGQVISLWVRSAIDHSNSEEKQDGPGVIVPFSSVATDQEPAGDLDLPLMAALVSSCVQPDGSALSQEMEISYIEVLNRVLPLTIRIICWSPVSDTFSARFSCQFRHYKYFFPASPDLDVSQMRDAAARLVGTHDFRNLCTLDGSKQIANYKRVIRRADISPVGPDESNVNAGAICVLDLVGSAFLYNQVRSIMAILFLIGSGLEQPHVVSSLLNVDPHNPLPPYKAGEPIQVVDRKPSYQMADALPLLLWDCGYNEEDIRWRTNDGTSASEKIIGNDGSVISTNLRFQALSLYNRSRIRTTLDGHFLRATERHFPLPHTPFPLTSGDQDFVTSQQSTKLTLNVPVGGGMYIRTAKYKPLLARVRGESSDIINERWRLGRGKKRWEERLAKQDST